MDATVSPPVGQLLGGRYDVGSRIARGGMATVYLATDTRLNRTVALKIIHPELSGDADFVRRFVSEAHAAARLNNPNVVAIYDQGSDAGTRFLALEYVPGRTLRSVLAERGRLPPAEALEIMAGVLSGLAAAHQAGIAHRDVKPENVLLTPAGQVKVADFGLARAVAGTAAAQTKGGMIIGTAAYLAPEQVTGGRCDARTDVYAAGIMLFELLTGVQPVTGETPLAVAHQHVTGSVPAPSSVVARLPGDLDALVAYATSRDPELRPADAGEFLSAVSDVRDGQPIVLRRRVPGRPAANPVNGAPGWPEPAAAGPGLSLAGTPASADPMAGGTPPAGDAMPPGGTTLQGSALLAGGVPPPGDTRRLDMAPGARGATTPGAAPMPGAAVPDGAGQAGDTLPPLPAVGHDHGVNRTMVVPAGDPRLFGDGYDDGGGYRGRPPGRTAHRRQRRQPEPLLQRLLFSRRLALLAAGTAMLLVLALLAWWLTNGRYGTVPRLRGLTLSSARADLRTAGFAARTGQAKHSGLPKGEVIGTSPAASSRAVRGSAITVIVSLGPVLVAVPGVTGIALPAAKAALRRAGLVPGTVSHGLSTTIPAGVVLSTSPAAGVSLPKGGSVRLTVSEGPPLPNFVGQQLSAAQAAAAAGNYTINPIPDAKSQLPAGSITGQSPAVNTPITPGEVVTVKVSQGPKLQPVPDVRGYPLGVAIQTIRSAGFRPEVHRVGLGDVIAGTTPSGTAPPGSVVVINIGFTLFP